MCLFYCFRISCSYFCVSFQVREMCITYSSNFLPSLNPSSDSLIFTYPPKEIPRYPVLSFTGDVIVGIYVHFDPFEVKVHLYLTLSNSFYHVHHPKEIPRYLLSGPFLCRNIIVGIYVHFDPLKLNFQCTCKLNGFCLPFFFLFECATKGSQVGTCFIFLLQL